MGMFDYVICEYPLPDKGAERVTEWQTKTFDAPYLLNYKVTAEGRLLSERIRFEDRSDKTAPPGSLASIIGIETRVHEGWEDMNFDGELEFTGYTDDVYDDEHCYNYTLWFDQGQLVRVKSSRGETVRPLTLYAAQGAPQPPAPPPDVPETSPAAASNDGRQP